MNCLELALMRNLFCREGALLRGVLEVSSCSLVDTATL